MVNFTGACNLIASYEIRIEEQEHIIAKQRKDLESKWIAEWQFNQMLSFLDGNIGAYFGVRPLLLTQITDKKKRGNVYSVKLSPQNIVCILTDLTSNTRSRGRRKVIYATNGQTDKKLQVIKYYLNSAKLPNGEPVNWDTLRQYLDPWRHFLIEASSGAVFNDAFYELKGRNLLVLHGEIKISNEEARVIKLTSDRQREEDIRLAIDVNRANRKRYSSKGLLHQDLNSYIEEQKRRIETDL